MRIRPGVEVYWREPGASQFGLDPRFAVIFDGLTPRAQQAIETAPDLLDITHLHERGNQIGMPAAQVRDLVRRVEAAGLLTDSAIGNEDDDAHYWHRAALAGVNRNADRTRAFVEVRGLDRVGLRLAMMIAEAGVGSLALDDDAPVRHRDVAPGQYRPGDVNTVRAKAAASVIEAAVPQVHLRRANETRPDLVAVVHQNVVDPVRVRTLMREDIAHLNVLVGELSVTVGPLVRPGLSACTQCMDLYRCTEDERWPAVAAQAATRTGVHAWGTESTLAWSGAALAAQQVVAFVDGRAVASDGATLDVTAWQPVPEVRAWCPHPRCGCTADSLTEPVR